MFRFFIEHPRFSIVISIVITIAGLVSVRSLPIEKFPDLSPPVVEVTATYPGASADVVEKTVTALIEQEINGVPGMIAIDSVSTGDGTSSIKVVFEIGSDIDTASVLVQNRVQKAESGLPEEVRREGIVVEAASPNILAIMTLSAEDPKVHDELFLSNYALLNVKDALARVPGVGRVDLLGAREYGMRVWLDPDKLRVLDLSPEAVTDAIVAQNVQLAGGRIGAAPTTADQRYQFSVIMPGRLATTEEFGRIIVRTEADGSGVIRLQDVAELELGAQNYDITARLGGKPTAALMMFQRPGSNALAAVQGAEAEMERLSKSFPPGIHWANSYDSTDVIEASIDEMVETLVIAVVLVVLVVFIFLGGVRPTIVPAIAVPVSLIGTLALMAAFDFSLNTLSLFGLILAIGIVVDDAILVVESAMHNIEEGGLQPKEAAIAAMDQVGGAVIASTLVLMAVFVPVAFIPGLTGRLFQQFALTISASVFISMINALTLSPALASLILPKPGTKETWLAKTFNRGFNPIRKRYVGLVHVTLVRKLIAPVVLIVVCGATMWLARAVPGGFVPLEDDGVIMMQVSLPDAASTNRTQAMCDRITEIVLAEESVASVISFSGHDQLADAVTPNKALFIITLHEWSEREDPEQELSAIKKRLDGKLLELVDASVFSFQMPPIPGLGVTSGIDFELQNRGGVDAQTLAEIAHDFAATASEQPAIARAVVSFTAAVPQVAVTLDREQIQRLNVPLGSVQDTLASNLSSRYTDDFVLFGRTFRVMVSARAERVSSPFSILDLTTRTATDDLVPLGAVADVKLAGGPGFITRYNLYPSARVTAVPAPGYSSSEAMEAMEAVAAATLGPDFGYEWSGQAREERLAAGASTIVFALSIVLVFLFLTAQYESFTTPISVLLMVPMAVFGAFLAQFLVGLPIDLYTQVGLVLLVGLTAKTAILLVELSKQQVDAGKPPEEAAEHAAHLRFRAVVMTAGVFILGMVPMLIATGAGAESRVSLGNAVTGGMFTGIAFTLLLVPRLYVLIQNIVHRVAGRG
jgi:hydrophobic/amphiphilic exporter-1 (mainly G- bacteria), HAE1 family